MQDRITPPPVGPILESAIYVADIDRSVAFYQRLFGLPQYMREDRMCALGLPGGAVLLVFREGGSVGGARSPIGFIPGHGATGPTHLCFKIAAADLEPWAAFLDGQGIEIESRIVWPAGGTSLYFRDPDAHSVEIATPGLWPNYARE